MALGRSALYVTTLVVSACSLRSLDYLDSGSGGRAGDDGRAGSDTRAGSGSASGAGGAPDNVPRGGVPAQAGSEPGTAAAAGSAPEVPDCNDGATTADETDRDCGGRTCQPCADHQRCSAGTDCQSAICTNQVCQPPNCLDLAVNGAETDLNCGGSCPKCAQGRSCEAGSDCATGSCSDGICESVTCTDGVLRAGCPLLVDNTPYSLSPAHALTSCIDDDALSVAEGTAMILFECGIKIHQTFWAVEREGGYFAFRNALSGKCLQVRGSSMQAGAVIEQSGCDYVDAQLWKPSIVDASLMQLTSKSSGLALDVAGDDVNANGQPIVQGEANRGADTSWRVLKRTSAAYLAFSPGGDTAIRIRHDAARTTIASDDEPNAHWKVVPGLDNPDMVSFQSRKDPGRYLRHASFRLWTDSNDGSTQFKRDATFRYSDPFASGFGLFKALQSSNYPGHFWRRNGPIVTLNKSDGTAEYADQASWRLDVR